VEEIKVGEYVRDRAGNIAKVMKNHNTVFEIELNTGARINQFEEFIVKHSKNIIDLIEVGDIVHIKDVLHEDITHIWSEDYLKALKEDLSNGIKLVEILTHEQFEQNSYKV